MSTNRTLGAGAKGRRQLLRDPPGFRGPGAARQGTGQIGSAPVALGVQEREARLGYVAEAAGRP